MVKSNEQLKEDNKTLKRTIKELRAEIVIDNKQLRERRLLIDTLNVRLNTQKEMISMLKTGREFTIPNSIILFNETYKIKMQDKVIISNGVNCSGLVDHDKKIIQLHSKNNDLIEVLLHEIAHVLDRQLRMSTDKELFANTFGLFYSSVYYQLNKNVTPQSKRKSK